MARRTKRFKTLRLSFTAISIVICIIIGLLLKNSEPEFQTDKDFVRVLDVGQAECILIYSNGYTALIDTGLASTSNDVIMSLEQCDIEELDVLLITHLHNDHSGGIPRLLESFKVHNLILPELSAESEGLTNTQLAIKEVAASGGEVYNAVQGMNFKIGSFEITVLAAYGDMKDENDRSVVSVAEIDGVKFIFTGDAGIETEAKLISEGIDLECDVLNVGHHGGNTASSEEFLRKAYPKYGVISCGEGNLYGHPQAEVLSALAAVDAEIYRTDLNGDITFYVEDGEINVETER